MKGMARIGLTFAAGIVLLACCGCTHPPGVPPENSEVVRPDKQVDFLTLYSANCSGCHGDNGRGGAAIPLNNPAYLAVAGPDNLRSVIEKGMPQTLMPAFAVSSGGMLTTQQVDALVRGMIREWARPAEFSSVTLPAYSASTPGDAADGQKAYSAACARCHGADGAGTSVSPGQSQAGTRPYSIVDTSYLNLTSDQDLRSIVIAGHIDWNAPDWRSYIAGRALDSKEISDIVAWLAAHRTPEGLATNNTAEPPGVSKKENQ
jgi:mono/diheme cytochrome c family protein